MYPKSIEFYFAPTSLEEVLKLLDQYRGNAKLLAGGQSLLPLLKLRLVEPQCIIDLNQITGLAEIRQHQEVLCLGPMMRHAEIATHPLIRGSYPILADAARVIGDPQVRNRGTLGGSLVHADPAADYPVAVLALGTQLVLTKAAGGTRTLPADEFFIGPLTSAADEDELLTEVQLPRLAPHSGGAYAKHSLVAGDFAVISVAAQLTLDRSARCERAAIVIGGLVSRPALAVRAAELLVGTELDDTVCIQAGKAAAEEVEVGSDVRASAKYRRHLIKTYVPAMIRRAQERAGGAEI